MIDIHTHIVPCVDDGSDSLNGTISQVFYAKNQGVTDVFATPHSEAFFQNSDVVFRDFYRMKTVLQGIFPELNFYLGCEVMCAKRDMPAILAYLSNKRLPSMNGTRYVLAEFSPWISPEDASFCLSELQQAGWIPIIAHMERYVYLRRMAYIHDIRQSGCLIQVNVYSLEEYGEENVRDWARSLIHEKLVDFLGTDTHRSYYRPPSIEQGMNWLQQNCSKRYLEVISFQNASRLLINDTDS